MSTKKSEVFTFGKRVRRLREDRKLSIREVAYEIGVDTSLLSKIERDERAPTKNQIRLVASYFEFDELTLIKEYLSDLFAYRVIEADIGVEILKVAEQKVEYLKSTQSKKI